MSVPRLECWVSNMVQLLHAAQTGLWSIAFPSARRKWHQQLASECWGCKLFQSPRSGGRVRSGSPCLRSTGNRECWRGDLLLQVSCQRLVWSEPWSLVYHGHRALTDQTMLWQSLNVSRSVVVYNHRHDGLHEYRKGRTELRGIEKQPVVGAGSVIESFIALGIDGRKRTDGIENEPAMFAKPRRRKFCPGPFLPRNRLLTFGR